MTQPNMPNLPGFDAMADTLEFVKNMWGGMQAPTGIPGMVMPTLSVEEINKQIADLKAVESWLNVNMNMLRGTIQALEVQSATLSTLHAMGQTFGADMPQGANTAPNKADAAAAPHASAAAFAQKPASAADPLLATAAAGTPEAWWNMLQAQFNQAVSSVMAEEKPAAPKKEKPAARAARAPSAAAKKTAAKSGAKPRKKSAPSGKP
ncbi:PhaM family polyhydroxyalkanoate granule multifunctional regulatory protein [Herminiimonas sp.]|uniref:PhaM family polyhydroxyalkanoate granule multifunctional regulatory protein n=1 Tax=Herminiimonas sp. TaxID=1926289 RepID=UPI002726C6D6|nr:PhaM family polyhydroxyalkanoate granule multifunctional regulatory protein [Herminiimonas sp.]MDO8305769.1 hypothetical protein [Herminiimonas sp.]